MTQNSNNTETRNSRYTRKAVENLKAALKASPIEEITLPVYGIQIYASYVTGEEYTVIMKAERDIMTGRYYFIDRDGNRIAWSRLDADTLIHAAVDFADRMEEVEKQTAETVANLEKYEAAAVDADLFFYWVRPVLDVLGIEYHYTGHDIANDGRCIDRVKIDRPATRKPSEPVRHWLHTRPAEELAEMKADRIRKAEQLHEAGHYAAAVYASELVGMISDEQTARRADQITEAREAAKAERIRKAAQLLPVGGVVVTNDTNTRAIVTDGDRRVTLSTAELDEARRLLETARDLAQIVTTEQTPATDPTDTRASYKVLAVVALHLIDPATTTKQTTRRSGEYVETSWPFGGCLLTADDFARARRIADQLTAPTPAKGEGVATEATTSPTTSEQPAQVADTTPTASEAHTSRENAPKCAPVIAAALFLLSLTIGNGKPATMYTDDPAAVVAQVTEAGETLTAYEWHPVPTPDALPPYDVPALA